jgi:ATP-dependent Clp protease ATP-binding subunit ClpC
LWSMFDTSFYNLIFWLSAITDLYLWAEFIEHRRHKRLRTEILRDKAHSEPVDVYDLFSKEAIRAWSRAASQASTSKVTGQHVLMALLEDEDVRMLFMRLGLSPEASQKLFASISIDDQVLLEHLPYAAYGQAIEFRSLEISPLTLFVALITELPENHELLRKLNEIKIDAESMRVVARWIITVDALILEQKQFSRLASFKPDNEINIGLTAVPTPYLDQFSEDVTVKAKYGHLPVAVGREADIDKVFAVLDEGKPFVLLVGDPGVGRTTMINDIAHRMATEAVPRLLQDKRLVEMQLSALAGSRVPAEKVLMEALAEAEKSGNIVLVMEDIHLLARMQSSQGLSLLEVFVNYLQSSPLVVLSSTTENDYQNYLHNALNFTSLFSTYELAPLSEQAILMAACIKVSLLEGEHKVFFTYDAIREAMRLSDEYIHDVGQPQKTVAVLTEVAAKMSGNKHALITPQIVAEFVSQKTHVPVEVAGEAEAEKLMQLEQNLGKYIIGQTEAVKAVSAALRRARSGLESKKRPIASFLFVGPTGVGKTELAKTLAQVYFGDAKLLLRLDMSEYRGSDGLQKLLGGSGDSTNSLFVNHLKNYPFCLFLLDEFEKASPEVLNLFLQILEDGRLTTGAGETLDLTHTIIIATSNAGTFDIQTGIKAGMPLEKIKTTIFDTVLMQHFAPELLNRFDGVILFTPLSPGEVEQIARLQLTDLAAKLSDDKGLTFTFSDNAVSYIAAHGYDQTLGARPIRRFIQDSVENLLADYLLTKRPSRGASLSLDIENDILTLK